MVNWLLSCLLPQQLEMKCRQKITKGMAEGLKFLSTRLTRFSRQSCCPARHLSHSHPELFRFYIMRSSFPIKSVEEVSFVWVDNFIFKEYVALPIKKRLPGPVTEWGNRWPPSMPIDKTTTGTSFHYAFHHFGCTVNLKVRWRKNIRIRETMIYR